MSFQEHLDHQQALRERQATHLVSVRGSSLVVFGLTDDQLAAEAEVARDQLVAAQQVWEQVFASPGGDWDRFRSARDDRALAFHRVEELQAELAVRQG